MKKKFFLCVFLLLTLCACQSTVRVHRNGVTYQDNPMLKEKRVTITYPDGSSFAATYSILESVNLTSVGNATWSSDYDPYRYIDGTELVYIACDEDSAAVFSLLLQFLLLAAVAAGVVYLNFHWYSSIHKWHKAYKEQEKRK